MKNNIENIKEAVKKMLAAWESKKMEVCDFEMKESWIVETLNPEKFHEFYDALDLFLTRFQGFERELREKEAYKLSPKNAYVKIKEVLGEK